MKNKKPKPRVMWAIYDRPDPMVSGNLKLMRHCEKNCGVKAVRVAVIPLDDVEAIVERALTAYFSAIPNVSIVGICAALTAAGIPCRKARK